jgi:nucleoside-diphosphate-sugar epimerase
MKILISGATGVIGRRVVPLLRASGHAVTALTRKPDTRIERLGIASAVADLFDVGALARAAAGHDAIVNLATHMPSSAWKMMFRSAWRLNDRIRREGAANIVEAALAGGIRTLVQESFALTYPDRGDGWIDEETPLEPAGYNRTVLDAERAVRRFTASGGTGIVLRFAAFYGPDAMQVRSYIGALRMGWAALPGGPDRYISSISHDDAAAAVAAVLDVPAGAYTVADDEPVVRSEYFGSLAKNLGLRPPRFLPQWSPRFASVGDGWPSVLSQMNEV